jgi:DNA adenine methylase
MTATEPLKAPFPWFGGKSRAADLVWSRFGDVRNYVEPFAGSLAVMLRRPTPARVETVNDLDCYVANFWRAVSIAPEEVAQWADSPVNEADLHARHAWLVGRAEFRERMKVDPEYFDARIAGWWCWGLASWIGGWWCSMPKAGCKIERRRPQATAGKSIGVQSGFAPGRSPDVKIGGRGVTQKMPAVYYRGATGVARQIPDINGMGDKAVQNTSGIEEWFFALQERLRRVRVCCGDWKRVLGPTPLGTTDNVPNGFVTGVMLDPPYAGAIRDPSIYAQESATVSADVRAWALEHGDDPRLRIALCGYEGEHVMPETWECVPWKAGGGYGNQSGGNANAALERIWFSPHCLKIENAQRELFS